jgi:hypothetical protein
LITFQAVTHPVALELERPEFQGEGWPWRVIKIVVEIESLCYWVSVKVVGIIMRDLGSFYYCGRPLELEVRSGQELSRSFGLPSSYGFSFTCLSD